MQKLYVPVRESLIFYNIYKKLQKNGQYESLSFPTKALLFSCFVKAFDDPVRYLFRLC